MKTFGVYQKEYEVPYYDLANTLSREITELDFALLNIVVPFLPM